MNTKTWDELTNDEKLDRLTPVLTRAGSDSTFRERCLTSPESAKKAVSEAGDISLRSALQRPVLCGNKFRHGQLQPLHALRVVLKSKSGSASNKRRRSTAQPDFAENESPLSAELLMMSSISAAERNIGEPAACGQTGPVLFPCPTTEN